MASAMPLLNTIGGTAFIVILFCLARLILK